LLVVVHVRLRLIVSLRYTPICLFCWFSAFQFLAGNLLIDCWFRLPLLIAVVATTVTFPVTCVFRSAARHSYRFGIYAFLDAPRFLPLLVSVVPFDLSAYVPRSYRCCRLSPDSFWFVPRFPLVVCGLRVYRSGRVSFFPFPPSHSVWQVPRDALPSYFTRLVFVGFRMPFRFRSLLVRIVVKT